MKKRAKLKRKTVRMIVKNLIVLVVLAFVAFAGIFAWFTDDHPADSTGVVASARVGDGLEFYVMPPSASDQYNDINTRLANNATWNSQHQNDQDYVAKNTKWHTSNDEVLFDFTDQEFKFMEGLFLCEVTSDGKLFQIPKLMQYDEIAYVDTTQSFDAAVANDEYMSFDLYFRSESAHSVNLMYDSSISPATTYPAGSYQHPGDDTVNPKKDAAIGAVRMSIMNMTGNGERELLWIPGASVYYDGTPAVDTLYTGLTESQFGNKGAAYYDGSIQKRANEGTNTHAYYSDKDHRYVIRSTDANLEGTLVASTSANNYQLGTSASDNIQVLTMPVNNYDAVNRYYYGHIRVNLWVEGEDAEARLNFVGGKFKMALHFELAD